MKAPRQGPALTRASTVTVILSPGEMSTRHRSGALDGQKHQRHAAEDEADRHCERYIYVDEPPVSNGTSSATVTPFGSLEPTSMCPLS